MTVNPTPIEKLGNHCAATGLHRFRTRKAADAHLTDTKINAALNGNSDGGQSQAEKVWPCTHCGGWHNRKPKRKPR